MDKQDGVASANRKCNFIFMLAAFIVSASAILLCCSACSTRSNDDSGRQSYAYLEVFKSMASDIDEDDVHYIGVNITNTLYAEPDEIKKLIEDYAAKYDVSIIWNDDENKYNSFKQGYLIIFNDIELSKTTLKTDATWLGAPALAGAGYSCVVEKKASGWVISKFQLVWLSSIPSFKV